VAAWLCSLKVDSGAHCDDPRAILRLGSASEIRIANRPVHSEVRPVERIERVRANLQTQAVSICFGPENELFDDRYVIREHRRLPELTVVL
jgi:hypothetical protein